VRFRRTFRAGQNQTITLHLAPNWASTSMGSTASGDAVAVTSPFTGNELVSAAQVRNNLIDDSEATDGQAPATQVGPAWEVDGRQVTVDLGGTSPVRINRVQVSAMLGLVFDPGARPRPADLTRTASPPCGDSRSTPATRASPTARRTTATSGPT
jgi:hypothetical protein